MKYPLITTVAWSFCLRDIILEITLAVTPITPLYGQ